MHDIKTTICEYEQSRAVLKGRIDELSREIGEAPGNDAKHLLGRRYALYVELWDCEYAMRQLRDYEDRLCVGGRTGWKGGN